VPIAQGGVARDGALQNERVQRIGGSHGGLAPVGDGHGRMVLSRTSEFRGLEDPMMV
jgi:hypothetical protein